MHYIVVLIKIRFILSKTLTWIFFGNCVHKVIHVSVSLYTYSTHWYKWGILYSRTGERNLCICFTYKRGINWRRQRYKKDTALEAWPIHNATLGCTLQPQPYTHKLSTLGLSILQLWIPLLFCLLFPLIYCFMWYLMSHCILFETSWYFVQLWQEGNEAQAKGKP